MYLPAGPSKLTRPLNFCQEHAYCTLYPWILLWRGGLFVWFSLLETENSELAHLFSSLLLNSKVFTYLMPPFGLHVAFLSSSWVGTIHRCDVPGAIGQGSELGPGGITLLYLLLIMEF